MRYKITIEYNGLNFIGWQKQNNEPINNQNSIQSTIETAIFNLTGEKVEVCGSGRTDANVHAFAQVAHFDLKQNHLAFKMQAGLNHYLRATGGIAILNCQTVADNFHSRFDAKMRHYQYKIINRYANLTIDQGLAWQVKNPLNIEAMKTASQYLLGKHNFKSFQDSECQAKSPIKTISKIDFELKDSLVKINFSAPSFLHHQIRNMVGTLVLVGLEKIKSEYIKEIIKAENRQKSGPNAPACGLYFVGVDYTKN